jgi:hypothetical protein
MEFPRPPLAYICRRAAELAETGQCSGHLDVQTALVREGIPEAIEVLSQRPRLRDYLNEACARARKEKTNA